MSMCRTGIVLSICLFVVAFVLICFSFFMTGVCDSLYRVGVFVLLCSLISFLGCCGLCFVCFRVCVCVQSVYMAVGICC